MEASGSRGVGFSGAFTGTGSSFAEFLADHDPSLLPGNRLRGGAGVPGAAGAGTHPLTDSAPHGTTIVSVTFEGGVVMAGDRRATMGNLIAQRDIEKVFIADEHSAVGIAGTAGLAIEMVRLFQVELEHYEKIEGAQLSVDGKANRLSTLIRGNLGLAMQGLAVVPLFAAFDPDTGGGRIFSYDVTGGRYEEHRYHSVGSGSLFARGSLKKLFSDAHSAADAVMVCLEALYDAADDDSATGGPDMLRGIYPVVTAIDIDGAHRWTDAELTPLMTRLMAARGVRPDGPAAPLPA